MINRVFDGSMNEFPEIMSFVTNFLAGNNIEKGKSNSILICAEEIVTNIIKYGYKDSGGSILISMDYKNSCFSIKFTDNATPFNPLESEDPDINAPLEKREIGGLGIFMVKNIMDEVKYEYQNGSNTLTLLKKIN